MYKNVIFDLDGTLLDTTEGILESVRFTLDKLKMGELPDAVLKQFIGPPVQMSFMKYCGCDAEQSQAAATVFRDYYKSEALLKAVPYPGIYDLCKELQSDGIKMAVATYKREDYALTLLKHFGFDQFCNPMHGADNMNILKKEDIVKLCLKEMGGTLYDSVLVGDTEHDALGAQKAGLAFIAVTYGFGFTCMEDVASSGYECIGIADAAKDLSKWI